MTPGTLIWCRTKRKIFTAHPSSVGEDYFDGFVLQKDEPMFFVEHVSKEAGWLLVLTRDGLGYTLL